MSQVGKDKVLVEGVKGKALPTTTKVGITAEGGWQAEFHYIFVGLDLEQKADWTERQIRHSMGKNVGKFSCLKFTLNGVSQEDPRNQEVATADFRIFAQTKDRSLVVKDSMEVPGKQALHSCVRHLLILTRIALRFQPVVLRKLPPECSRSDH